MKLSAATKTTLAVVLLAVILVWFVYGEQAFVILGRIWLRLF
ncbi:hypothetical protein ACIPYR_22680 [Streptomyces parvus]